MTSRKSVDGTEKTMGASSETNGGPSGFELVLPNVSRRKFLGGVGAAVASTTMLSATATLPFASAAAAQDADADDYKAIVCLFLAGGNDSWNMLVPTDNATYNRYAAARTDMALSRDGDPDAPTNRGPILPIDARGIEPGRSFGVHPAMPEVRDLFNSGAIGFVANVGTMITPIASPAVYLARDVPVPRSLFSHFDQVNQWQTAYPQGNRDFGWAGSIADQINGAFNDQSRVAMNISLAGSTRLLTGQQTDHYSIGLEGSIPIRGKLAAPNTTAFNRYSSIGREPTDSLAFSGQTYTNLLEQAYLEKMVQSVDLEREFSAAFANSTLTTAFDAGSQLERALIAVARTIKVRQALGSRRQVFFVQLGGWDHHQELINAHARKLGEVSRALKTFWDALGEGGVDARDQTVLFTASDFGRTLRSNGRGTDHAWGGNHIVMGGPVIGQHIHGTFPTAGQIGLGEGLDIGSNGRLLPTISVDEYVGEICQWFGVPNTTLPSVLTNCRNFFTSDVDRPIGFLRQDVGPGTAEFAVSCVAENGVFHVVVVNGGAEDAEFAVEVTGLPRRTRTVGPGEDFRFGFSGRPDGRYDIDVYRDGALLDSRQVDVACDPRVPVAVEHSCLARNGRIDIFLQNLEAATATYEVSITGLAPRTATLNAEDRMRVTFTGRPDGDYTVRVRRNGDLVHEEVVVVDCDPDLPVVVETSCFAGGGRVDTYLLNKGRGPATYAVTVGALSPRTIRLAPGQTAQIAVTGRRDGDYPVVVRRDGRIIYNRPVTIACRV